MDSPAALQGACASTVSTTPTTLRLPYLVFSMEGETRDTLVVVPLVGKCARTAMLCSVVHIAVPVCLGIIVIDILVPLPNSLGVEAALPPGAGESSSS